MRLPAPATSTLAARLPHPAREQTSTQVPAQPRAARAPAVTQGPTQPRAARARFRCRMQSTRVLTLSRVRAVVATSSAPTDRCVAPARGNAKRRCRAPPPTRPSLSRSARSIPNARIGHTDSARMASANTAASRTTNVRAIKPAIADLSSAPAFRRAAAATRIVPQSCHAPVFRPLASPRPTR